MICDHHCTWMEEIIHLLNTLHSQIAVCLENQKYVEVANNGRCEGQVEAFAGAACDLLLVAVLCYTEKIDQDSVAVSGGLSTMNHQP